jgi:hypothetical protein
MTTFVETWNRFRGCFQDKLPTAAQGSRLVERPISRLFQYEDHNSKGALCWLRLHQGRDQVIAVVTDLTGRLSNAASVTNSIESIAFEIADQFNLALSNLVLIEHYDYRGLPQGPGLGDDAEHFDLVELRWNRRRKEFYQPRWSRTPKTVVEELIQATLGDDRLEVILRTAWNRDPAITIKGEGVTSPRPI